MSNSNNVAQLKTYTENVLGFSIPWRASYIQKWFRHGFYFERDFIDEATVELLMAGFKILGVFIERVSRPSDSQCLIAFIEDHGSRATYVVLRY